MKNVTKAVLGGLCIGTVLFYTRRWYAGAAKVRGFHLGTENLDYSNHPLEELASKHLTDLNSAGGDQIMGLGISAEAVQRILENRPYRNKLDLLSRMVLSTEEYSVIKDRISVSEGRQAVKVG